MRILSKLQFLLVGLVLCFQFTTWAAAGDLLSNRYELVSANEKLVDNRGNGYEPLYGTRNVRAVLDGVFFRGGGNNVYHRSHPRSNQNPLPDDGLENLCQEGFTEAVYLYSTRFSTAPRSVRCTTFEGRPNELQYHQLSILSANRSEIYEFLKMVLEHVRTPRLGGLYAHCWNGWHASGTAAAYALKQFCGFSSEQAVAYWNANTDGNHGSEYNGIRNKIRNFTPFSDLNLSSSEREALCPNSSNFKF